MERVLKLLYQALGAIIFIIAVTLLLLQVEAYKSILDYTEEALIDPVMYRSDSIHIENKVSYSELLAYLLSPPEYNLEINGHKINKEEYNYAAFHSNPIPILETSYRKEYIYDSNGRLYEIKFISLTE